MIDVNEGNSMRSFLIASISVAFSFSITFPSLAQQKSWIECRGLNLANKPFSTVYVLDYENGILGYDKNTKVLYRIGGSVTRNEASFFEKLPRGYRQIDINRLTGDYETVWADGIDDRPVTGKCSSISPREIAQPKF